MISISQTTLYNHPSPPAAVDSSPLSLPSKGASSMSDSKKHAISQYRHSLTLYKRRRRLPPPLSTYEDDLASIRHIITCDGTIRAISHY